MSAMAYPGARSRRLTKRAARLLTTLSLALVFLISFMFFRYLEARHKDKKETKQVPSGSASLTQTGDGSDLLKELQDEHIPDEIKKNGVSPPMIKLLHKLNLSGIAEKPKPPGWPFDPMDYPKPRVFFDITIDGKPAGRIVFELFTKQAPRLAENFRALCTGDKERTIRGIIDRHGGQRLYYKGAQFYRVIRQFICQSGINTPSIYGGSIDDDPLALKLKHDKKGLLSAANIGPNTTTTHFSIVVAPAPHLDGHYPIFGQVIEGMDVVDKINALAKPHGSPDERPKLPVIISNCGELYCDIDNTGCIDVTLEAPRILRPRYKRFKDGRQMKFGMFSRKIHSLPSWKECPDCSKDDEI